MSYAGFLLALVVPPIILLAVTQPRRARAWGPLAVIAAAALIYTTPWDNFLVARGVWGYGDGRVLGVIGRVPIEEYVFFVLQPVLVGLLFLHLRHRIPPVTSPAPPTLRAWLLGFWLAVAAIGFVLIAVGPGDALYAGLILSWAAPALAGLSIFGSRHLWANIRPAVVTLGIASAYLWIIDRLAIDRGIWTINPQYSLGKVAGLPVEEALFFSITTWLCVHGLATMLPERRPISV